MGPMGKKNAYWCHACQRYTVTIDRDVGTTPYYIKCRTTDSCNQLARSMSYPKEPWPMTHPDLQRKPKWEWYKPSPEETKGLIPTSRDHVEQGGLLLRAVTK